MKSRLGSMKMMMKCMGKRSQKIKSLRESRGRQRKDTRVLWSSHKMICRKNRRRGRNRRSNKMIKIVLGKFLCLKVTMALRSELKSKME